MNNALTTTNGQCPEMYYAYTDILLTECAGSQGFLNLKFGQLLNQL